MSGWNPCTCDGTREEKMKNWFVSRRNYNNSYFEYPKGQNHYSDYSSVCCKKCTMRIRSKAKFVDNLPDGEL